MSNPRSSTNSYISKEYSFKSQIGSELPTNESRYLSNESELMWQNSSGNNSATLPLRTTSHYRSFNRSSNMNNAKTSSINYVTNEPDLQWQNNSSRIESRIRTESPNHLSIIQNINSSQLSPNTNENRDQFSIYGSYKKHISEKRDNSTRYESTKTIETPQTNYKNLPIKQNSTITYSPVDIEIPISSGLTSSGFFSPQNQQQNTLQDLLSFNRYETEKKPIVDEMPIKSETQKQAFSEIPILPNLQINDNNKEKDEEIKNLKKTINKLNKKIQQLQKDDIETKNHLKNLINERKTLIKQIENSEFEEIIEEEEVQRAKPNIVVNENQNQQKPIVIREDIVNENYIEKHKIGLQDLPKHVLNNYRQDIVEQEREKMELEKRTLMNTLQIQYQQKLQSIEQEKEVRKTQMKHVSIQSYKNRKFNETSSDVNLSPLSPQSIVTVYQPTTSSKQSQKDIKKEITKKYFHSISDVDLSKSGSFPRSIVTDTQLKTASKQTQNELIEETTKTISRNVSKSLNEYMRTSNMKISNWQKNLLERLLKSLESNDSENLSAVIREILLKQTKSVEVHSQPVMVSRPSQNEILENSNSKLASEMFSSFTKSIKKSHVITTKYQESILERFMDALKTNNSDMLSSLIEELLFKPSKTVGINSVPDNSNKNIQTQQLNFNNVSHEVNIVDETPKIERSSKSISVRPVIFHKGIQPDEKFYFETGTMTDHLFYRSQGVNTLNENSKSVYSPYSETDSYVTRTSSRSEAKKEFKSQTVIQSSTNNLQKFQKLQEKAEIKTEPKSKDIVEEWEQTFLVKEVKNSNTKSNISLDNRKTNVIENEIIKSHSNIQESAPKPKEIVEEWVQNIEEKVQIITAHVDKEQNVVEDTPTTVECWETISKIKDGKLIEKKECYRDKYVSSDPEEIIKHLESHSHDQHDHSHSKDLQNVEKSIELHQHVQNKKENIGDYNKNFISDTKTTPSNLSITETSYSKRSTNSSSIPIQKSLNEGEISKFKSYQSMTSTIPIGISRYESSSIVDKHSPSNSNESFSISERIEQSASSKSFNSPLTYSAFSSRSNNIKSSSQQIEITSSTKPNIFPKPVKIENSESNHSKHGTNINVKTFSETIPINENIDSSVIGSSNSAFYSLSELPKPPKDNQSYDYQEVLLPENIFQICNQILFWLNNNSKHVCINNSEHLPKELIQPSIILIDWWVDMVVKLTSSQLLSTVQYLISTFNKNFVKFLIINRDQQGNTCIHYIIGHQFWDSFSVLHATGLIDPNIYNAQGFTIMMLAATLQVTDDVLNNHIRKLAQSANLNLQSKDQSQTAIYLAALHDNDNTIDTLYVLGADINIRDSDENTPLMIAIERNNVKAVKAILSCPGVLLELRNKEGNTALKIAEQNNYTDIIDLFNQRKTIRRTEMSTYSNILQSSSNPTSPRSFRKFIFN